MMASIFPELESEYGTYPMKVRNWLYPIQTESDEKGRPALFLLPINDIDSSKKEHYVYGSVTHQHLGKRKGCYHLLTKEAYIILNKRMDKNIKMKLQHALSVRDRYKRQAWKETKQIVELGSVSGLADDEYARRTNKMLEAFKQKDQWAAIVAL
mmetsp:Transcript_593/g.961  ORF Transcript_593/g.961 Transcript_593/m.961 type:complete len:154 (-) Transcript_593:750-1211(-)